MKLSKIKLSLLAIYIVVLASVIIDSHLKLWSKDDRVIIHDVVIYYGYLPAIFIYNDIRIDKIDSYKVGDTYLLWPVFAPNGGRVFKMSMGLAILYVPFFIIGHFIAIMFHYDPGFSAPYKILLLISTIFYLAVGLFFLRKILIKYFSDGITAITLLLIGLGTNLLCYASQSAPMPHVYNFTLITLFMYYTIRWYETPKLKFAISLGLLLGVISLIRPSNGLILIFFILYRITKYRDLKNRIISLICNWKLISIVILCVFIVWLPQFLYWKKITGQFFYYSYGDEKFFFNNPKFLEGLFGFRKGWLVYTPMMIFALLGLIFTMKEHKYFQYAILVFTVLNLYIIFSWWCWWYGGTFGARSIIDSYALFAIPLAAFVKFIHSKNIFMKFSFYLICVFFIWLNIFNTYQFEYRSLHHDGMSKKLYFKQFGKLEKISEFDGLIDWANYDDAKKGIR